MLSTNGLSADIWVTETGWPHDGGNQGSAVAGWQQASTYFTAGGCGYLFGKYNVWWHTLDDSELQPPHFGVTNGPGQSSSGFPDNPSLKC